MARNCSRLFPAFFLVLACICYRLLGSLWPELAPNLSPMIAVALVGTMYLPRAWGWLVGPVAMLVTDLVFLPVDYRTEGSLLSWWTVASLLFFAAVGGLGFCIARNRTLLRIVACSVACSLVFYVLANTFAWGGGSASGGGPFYAPTLAGWWQANTVGLPGWQPSWTFLRNGVLGDLFFAGVLLAVFDRELLIHPLRLRASAPA